MLAAVPLSLATVCCLQAFGVALLQSLHPRTHGVCLLSGCLEPPSSLQQGTFNAEEMAADTVDMGLALNLNINLSRT